MRFSIRPMRAGNSGDGRPPGLLGRIFATLFFLMFGGTGLLITGLMARDQTSAHWTQTPCTILSSGVHVSDDPNDENPYKFKVRYSYEFAGRKHTSTHYRGGDASFGDYARAQALVDQYPADSRSVCYVDPANPSTAWLRQSSPWITLFLPIPLIFVAIGGGGIYFTWRGRKSGSDKSIAALARQQQGRLGPKGKMILWLVFLGTGSLFLCFFGRQILTLIEAQQWSATPCQVISSHVRRHSGDNGSTYSIDILYAYTFNGREYKSSRYDTFGGSSSGYDSKQAVVARHRPGTKTTCWVNPRNPREAVLDRSFSPWLLMALLPLAFVVIGLVGLVSGIRAKTRSNTPPTEDRPASQQGTIVRRIRKPETQTPVRPSGPVIRKPEQSRWKTFIGIIVLAVIWNGIVSVVVFGAFQDWQREPGGWVSHLMSFPTLVLIPFVAIGIILIGGVIYSFLALFNPRLTVEFSSDSVPLGGTVEVRWSMTGRTDTVCQLNVRLEGCEEAVFQRGTQTHHDRRVFRKIDAFHTTRPHEIASGRAEVTIPADTMHSFDSGHNKVLWRIVVQGEIHWWPDVKEDFQFQVLPLEAPVESEA